MKGYFILLCGFGLMVLSCKSDSHVTPLMDTSPKNAWVTIDLNIDYSIQFPANDYQGKGYSLRTPTSLGETPTLIDRVDQQASLSATFCNPNAYPCWLIQYGQELASPIPASIPYLNAKGESSSLDNTIGFTKTGKLIGILYYAYDPNLTFRPYSGRLYLRSKSSDSFQYAGRASFTESTRQELFSILSTLSLR